MCGPWTSCVLTLCLRHAKALEHSALTRLTDPNVLRAEFWTKDNVASVRLAQAVGLITKFEEGVKMAEHLWNGSTWTQTALRRL